MEDVREMQLGQLVDFCISYNERQKEAEEEMEASNNKKTKKPKTYKYRLATQEEIDAYFN